MSQPRAERGATEPASGEVAETHPDGVDGAVGDDGVAGPDGAAGGQETNPSFERLLHYLAETRAFDFTGYKRASLMRRVQHRMQTIGVHDFDTYTDFLQVNPDEFIALFNTILINVTSFFRDRESWDYLSAEILPGLVNEAQGQLRLWSAGCSAGQEAYSLAMAVAEIIGIEEFRTRVKIYATDVDEEALAYARAAVYTERELESLPEGYRERYFDSTPLGTAFRADMRRCVIFGRNDLTRDAPISRIDLLACRNTLMYFNAETQARVVSRLGFAARLQGVLFLGKAEMLLNHTDTFSPIELKRRFFRRTGSVHPDVQVTSIAGGTPARRLPTDDALSLRFAAFGLNPVAQLLVDGGGFLALANPRALQLTGLSAGDVGRRLTDLDISFRPVELRPHLDAARETGSVQLIRDVPWQRGPRTVTSVDIELVPLTDEQSHGGATLIVLTDVSRYSAVRGELEQATLQLQAASEELQSTNEELETTNEELQSTVEELETTNEELQSTNEELETMNEELQSMNDELQNTNEELRDRSAEVTSLNDFMRSVLGSMNFAVVVVDRELVVQVWNELAEDLWGVRTDEAVGAHLFNLDIGLPVNTLRPLLRSVLSEQSDGGEMPVSAINRRGRTIALMVSVVPLTIPKTSGRGALVVMRPDVPA